MPAKSKSNRVDFHECVKCHCIVHSKDTSTHINECSETGINSFSHAFIQNGVFHGVVSLTTGKILYIGLVKPIWARVSISHSGN